jgi:hypothetical protein
MAEQHPTLSNQHLDYLHGRRDDGFPLTSSGLTNSTR